MVNAFTYLHCEKMSFFLLLSILVFATGNSCLSALTNDSLQLRIVTELTDQKISHVCVIDSTSALAIGEKEIFQWQGHDWQPFTPPFPRDRIYPDYLKAFSLQNIWLFVRLADYYYRSLIYHYDGISWTYIPSPQPYSLRSVVFIDSIRFFATGDFSSLIYFDGKHAKNLSHPGGFSSLIAAAFSPTDFLIWVKENDAASIDLFGLYEYNNREWRLKSKVQHHPQSSIFLSPDSGYFISKKGVLFQYLNGQINRVDSLSENHSPLMKNLLVVYWQKKMLWNVDVITQERHQITAVPFSCQIYPITETEFFLQDSDKRVYYLGTKKYR